MQNNYWVIYFHNGLIYMNKYDFRFWKISVILKLYTHCFISILRMPVLSNYLSVFLAIFPTEADHEWLQFRFTLNFLWIRHICKKTFTGYQLQAGIYQQALSSGVNSDTPELIGKFQGTRHTLHIRLSHSPWNAGTFTFHVVLCVSQVCLLFCS